MYCDAYRNYALLSLNQGSGLRLKMDSARGATSCDQIDDEGRHPIGAIAP